LRSRTREYHKPGCIWEICPVCHVWLTTCDHKTLFSVNQDFRSSKESSYDINQTDKPKKQRNSCLGTLLIAGIIVAGIISGSFYLHSKTEGISVITLNPASGSPGSQFTIEGSKFTPNAAVADITWSGTPLPLGLTNNISNMGNITIMVNISASTSPGNYTIVMTDSSGKQASAVFTVN
jgi:hypothetical protein